MIYYIHSDFIENCEIEVKDDMLNIYGHVSVTHENIYLKRRGTPIGMDGGGNKYRVPLLTIPTRDVIQMINRYAYEGMTKEVRKWEDNFKPKIEGGDKDACGCAKG